LNNEKQFILFLAKRQFAATKLDYIKPHRLANTFNHRITPTIQKAGDRFVNRAQINPG